MSFQNDFSFSFSQLRSFTECPRKWWLDKVLAWKGWEKSAAPERRHSYRLKKLQNVWSLAGSTVHDIAAAAVSEGLPQEAALSLYDRKMRQAWREARAEAALEFSEDPKRRCNLAELYYQNYGVDDLKRYSKLAYDRGREAVANLYRSPILPEAREGHVLEAESLEQFDVGGVPTWVVVDLAYRPAGLPRVKLVDWKTGKPKDQDADQMTLYALYALERLGAASLGEVDLVIVYLKTGEHREVSVSERDLEETRRAIRVGAESIRSKLDDPGLNEAPASRFPRTSELSKCARCDLFFACKGHRDLSRPERIEPGTWAEEM